MNFGETQFNPQRSPGGVPKATTEDEPREGYMSSQWEKESDSAQELKMEQNLPLYQSRVTSNQYSNAGSACTVPPQYTGLCTHLSAASQGQWQMAPARVQTD